MLYAWADDERRTPSPKRVVPVQRVPASRSTLQKHGDAVRSSSGEILVLRKSKSPPRLGVKPPASERVSTEEAELSSLSAKAKGKQPETSSRRPSLTPMLDMLSATGKEPQSDSFSKVKAKRPSGIW